MVLTISVRKLRGVRKAELLEEVERLRHQCAEASPQDRPVRPATSLSPSNWLDSAAQASTRIQKQIDSLPNPSSIQGQTTPLDTCTVQSSGNLRGLSRSQTSPGQPSAKQASPAQRQADSQDVVRLGGFQTEPRAIGQHKIDAQRIDDCFSM